MKLDALKRLAELQTKCTPGLWWSTDVPWGDGGSVHAGKSNDPHTADAWVCAEIPGAVNDSTRDDMTFIAAARNIDLAAVVAELERLRKIVQCCERDHNFDGNCDRHQSMMG